jgi:hypothetical protein
LTSPPARRTVAPVRRRQHISIWLARWGFAAVVGLVVVVGLIGGATVALPPDIPGVALRRRP